MNSWSQTIHRKLYLLADNPDSLTVTLKADNELEFYQDETFIGWVTLRPDGSPLRIGSTSSRESYTEFGELAQYGSISWPRSGKSTSGWNFELLSLSISPDMPPVDFTPPENMNK